MVVDILQFSVFYDILISEYYLERLIRLYE